VFFGEYFGAEQLIQVRAREPQIHGVELVLACLNIIFICLNTELNEVQMAREKFCEFNGSELKIKPACTFIWQRCPKRAMACLTQLFFEVETILSSAEKKRQTQRCATFL
jgi:hypothetical protein